MPTKQSDGTTLTPTHPGSKPPTPVRVNPNVPVVYKGDTGDIVIPANTGAFVDLDLGGNAAARPMDIVLPKERGCKVGDWLECEAWGMSASTAAQVYVDLAVVVAGVKPAGHTFAGPGTWGIQGWALVASAASKIAGGASYQLQAGDFEADGSVRLRVVVYNGHATVNRTILRNALFQFRLEVKGPFAPGQ